MALRDMKLGLFALAVLATGVVAKDDNEQCGIYLALSSTSTADDTVWGIYAGKDYQAGDTLGSPEIAVNALNLRANNVLDDDTPQEMQDYLNKPLEFMEESFWVGDTAGAKFELEEGRIISAISGAGFLGAYEKMLVNADWDHRSVYSRTVVGEEPGAPHPNRGAISPFYNVTLKASDKIQKGSEIFVNYGASWEQDDENAELTKADFERIDDTVEQMIEFFKKHAKELDTESKMAIYKFITKDVMNAAVGAQKARKVTAILPTTPDDLANVKIAGGSLAFSQPSAFRSTEWLSEHGRCMDNIKVGPSKIKNAGRGAIATRKLKKGTIIAATPLIQITNHDVLAMYELEATGDGDLARASDEVEGQQMLLNYCFGHPESSLLFYPTAGVVTAINHADKPNAKLVWSDHPSNNKHWFELEPEELLSPDNAYYGLLFEIVALKDISEGEEVTIHYGAEWKTAWDEHVRSWKEAVDAGDIPNPWPKRAVEMNEEYKTTPFKTPEELETELYPETVALVAFLMLAEDEAAGTLEDPKTWTVPPSGNVFATDNLFEPEVISRVKVEGNTEVPYNYTIRWSNNKGENTYVKGVPHEAFVFVDEPETSDEFVEGAFRHYIGIPDEIFPQGPWRNVEAEEEEEE